MSNVSLVRKIYPYLCDTAKNRKWRSLSAKELEALMNEKQVISNCYDVATRYSLLSTQKGKEFLLKRIKLEKGTDNPHCKVTFNIDGKNKTYVSSLNSGSLSSKIASAVTKMIRMNPSQKPLISQFGKCGFNRACEFNYPSHAFSWYTGKKPISIGENEFNLSLRPHKEEVINLLNSAAKEKSGEYSLVVISGHQANKLNGHRRWHCLPIVEINPEDKTLKIVNKRTDEVILLSFDELVNKFKGLVGFKNI